MSKTTDVLIRDAIKDLVFANGYPDYNSLDDAKLAKIAGSFNIEYINTLSISSIIMDEAYTCADNSEDVDKKFFSEEDKETISATVLSKLSSMPFKYTFIFPMPYSANVLDFEFNSNIHIKTLQPIELDKLNPKPAKTEPLKLSSLEKLLNRDPVQMYKQGNTVLMIDCVGWVSTRAFTIHVSSVPNEDPLFTFKIINAAYLVQNILRRENREPNKWYPVIFVPYRYYIHYSDTYGLSASKEESTDDARFISERGFITEPFDNINKQIASLFLPIKNLPKKVVILNSRRSISIALYWYYEALKTSQTHVKLVYLTTAIDALLPDIEQKERKADFISNVVVSNLITQTIVYEDVIKLYALRNAIVHGKQSINMTYRPNDIAASVANRGEFVLMLFIRWRLKNYSDSIYKFNS